LLLHPEFPPLAASQARCMPGISAARVLDRAQVGGPVYGSPRHAAPKGSLLLDHFGWLRAPVHAINAWRIAGAVLMIAGVSLTSKF